MLPVFVKISAIFFFGYVGLDALREAAQIRNEIAEGNLNPILGATFKNRAIRRGLLFLFLALLAVGALFVRIAPLGE